MGCSRWSALVLVPLLALASGVLSACGERSGPDATAASAASGAAKPDASGSSSAGSTATAAAPESPRTGIAVEPPRLQTAPAMTVTPPPVESGDDMVTQPPPAEPSASGQQSEPAPGQPR